MTASVPFDPVQTVHRRDVLPAVEEAHEVRRRDRLDLASQRAQRAAVDPREDAAIAPLVCVARAKRAAQHLPLGLELQQRAFDRGGVEREARREFGDRRRTARLEPAANQLGRRRLARLGAHERRRDRVDLWIEHRARVDLREQREPLGADPERRAAGADRRRAAVRAQRLVERLPGLDRRQRDQREQRVVQFVGVAHDRVRLVGDRFDRRRIEDADAVGRGAAERAPRTCTARARRSSSGASSR